MFLPDLGRLCVVTAPPTRGPHPSLRCCMSQCSCRHPPRVSARALQLTFLCSAHEAAQEGGAW